MHGLRHSVQESMDVRLSGKYRTPENVGFAESVFENDLSSEFAGIELVSAYFYFGHI